VWRSLVARFVRDEEVVGSNPATPTEVGDPHRVPNPSSEGPVNDTSRRPTRSELGPVTRAYVESMGWRSLNLHMHISLVNKYVYVEVPKAGCGTMKATLGGMEAARLNAGFVQRVQERPHDRKLATPFIRAFQLPPEFLEDVLTSTSYRRFTVVRDPATRALSAYLEKIRQGLKQSEAITTALTVLTGKPITAKDVSFAQFLEVVSEQPPRDQDPHWRVQSAHLGLGIIEYDALIHLENLDESWPIICDLTGAADLHETFFCRNATNAARHVDEHVTPELRERLSQIYADDYRLLDYSRT
jgi:hypothetical protein